MRLFDLTRTRSCLVLFLVLAIPTLAGMSFLAGPFQTLDESSHFYRVVQLSQGRILPVTAPDGRSSGDYLDTNLHRLGGYFLFLSYYDWGSRFGAGAQDEAAAWAMPLAGRTEFVPFSNTVIYFPLAHAAPAIAVAALRAVGAPPMAWLYGGRLANAVLAVLVFAAALVWFPEGRVFVFVLALLPRTVFGTAALSADALLVPFAALFAALLARLAERGRLTPLHYASLIVAMAFVCLGKIAYVPLAALPPLTAFLATRRVGRPTIILSAASLATLLVWMLWLLLIRNDVHPIRSDVPIDVYAQLHQVVAHPLHGAAVLLRTFRQQGLGYLNSLVGGQLGSNEARFPYSLVAVTWVVLALSAFIGRRPAALQPLQAVATAVVVGGAALAVFLLLYMQFTSLDAPTVDGVQGRYFLPLLPFLVAYLPTFRWAAHRAGPIGLFTAGWMLLASADTLHLMQARFGNPLPIAGQSLSDPHAMKIE